MRPNRRVSELASGLTRNQDAPLKNAEENGTSHKSAAPGAAVGAENGRESGDASDGRKGQGTVSTTDADGRLAEVLTVGRRWPSRCGWQSWRWCGRHGNANNGAGLPLTRERAVFDPLWDPYFRVRKILKAPPGVFRRVTSRTILAFARQAG